MSQLEDDESNTMRNVFQIKEASVTKALMAGLNPVFQRLWRDLVVPLFVWRYDHALYKLKLIDGLRPACLKGPAVIKF